MRPIQGAQMRHYWEKDRSMSVPRWSKGERREVPGEPGRRTRGRHVAAALVTLVAALALLAGCDTRSAGQTPTHAATATATAAPHVLYTADWSHGADGWTLPDHWHVQDGALVNDGSGNTSVTVPYTVTTANYEVDMDIQVLSVTRPQDCGNLYGLEALDRNGQQLFLAQIWCIGNHTRFPGASEIVVPSTEGSQGFATADFVLNSTVKTYRVPVRGEGVRFYPGSSAAVGGAESSVPLAPATFALVDGNVQLAITRFVVLSA
jgi:hypothetical protein